MKTRKGHFLIKEVKMENAVREPPVLVRVRRLDSIKLDAADKTYFTDEGYLIDHPILTSVGIFEYRNNDGSIRRELRLPEHVFKAESLESYKGKPIIITHKAGEVDKDNVSKEQIGTIMTAGYQDGDDVRAEIIIHDTDKMKDCGLKELSLGYNLDLIEEPGEWEGQKYDAIQTNIIINHLALVANARAGDQARLNIDGSDEPELKGEKVMADTKAKVNDSGDALTPEELEQAIKEFKAKKGKAPEEAPEEPKQDAADEPEEEIVVEEQTDSEDEEEEGEDLMPVPQSIVEDSCDEPKEPKMDEGSTPEDILARVQDHRDRRDEEEDKDKIMAQMDADIDALSAALEKSIAEKKADKKADKKDSSEDESKSLNMDAADEMIRTRLSICRIGDKLNLDGLEDMSIADGKKQIIKKVLPEMRLDGKSDTFLDVAFELAIGEMNKKSTDVQREQMHTKHADSAINNVSMASSARARMIEREGGNN